MCIAQVLLKVLMCDVFFPERFFDEKWIVLFFEPLFPEGFYGEGCRRNELLF